MGTKSNPAASDCYAIAKNDEPLFTLLARDFHAPEVIRFWAMLRADDLDAGLYPPSDQTKVAEALACANAMEVWRAENKNVDGTWRVPAPLLDGIEGHG